MEKTVTTNDNNPPEIDWSMFDIAYENGMVNHVDFRVWAKQTADDAIEMYERERT